MVEQLPISEERSPMEPCSSRRPGIPLSMGSVNCIGAKKRQACRSTRQEYRSGGIHDDKNTETEVSMTTRTCKIGIHGRNHEEWGDIDFQVLRDAGVEVIKPMSQTRPHHFERMKRELPNVEIITRLYDDRIRYGHRRQPNSSIR
jgi:hypothetical protein